MSSLNIGIIGHPGQFGVELGGGLTDTALHIRQRLIPKCGGFGGAGGFSKLIGVLGKDVLEPAAPVLYPPLDVGDDVRRGPLPIRRKPCIMGGVDFDSGLCGPPLERTGSLRLCGNHGFGPRCLL